MDFAYQLQVQFSSLQGFSAVPRYQTRPFPGSPRSSLPFLCSTSLEKLLSQGDFLLLILRPCFRVF